MPKTIYTKPYRKIWMSFYGDIPKDSTGRSYEIHHIDGDKSNNDISNLQCVSVNEHFDIHYANGDYGACALIATRMNKSKEEISNLLRLSWTDARKLKQSEVQKNKFKDRAFVNNHQAGLKKYYKTADKERLSARSRLGSKTQMLKGNHPSLNPVAIAKRSKTMTGKGNPFYGKTHTLETIDNIKRNASKLSSRPIVIKLRRIAKEREIKLGSGWWQKGDQELVLLCQKLSVE